MTDTLKVLGQASPAANTPTSLYTVPSLTSAVVARLTACNTGLTGATIRVWVQIAGAADSVKQYELYDHPLQPSGGGGNSVECLTGEALATTDVIRVQASSSNVAFKATGVEVT